MEFNELTEAQKAKAKECKTSEELMALAREEGVELTDAQIEAIAGGCQISCHCDGRNMDNWY